MKKQNSAAINTAKEPIKLRFKKLANGNQSLYLDYYNNGTRTYEFLKLYITPEPSKQAADFVTIHNKNSETLQTAKAILARRIIDKQNADNGFKLLTSKSKISVYAFLDKFIEAKNKASTKINYGTLKQHLINFVGEQLYFNQIDKMFCLNFIDYLQHTNSIHAHEHKKLAESTQNVVFINFASILKAATRQGIIATNPTATIEPSARPKARQAERPYLDIDELKQLIKTPCKYEQVKSAFLFACNCGLRISDIINLTWANIQKQNNVYFIVFIQQKTSEQNNVPLNQNALKYLPPRTKNTDKIFTLPTIMTINTTLKNWGQAAGITKRVTTHIARHTNATLLIESGADIYSVQKLLGHSNIKTTEIYAKLVDKKKRQAVNLIPSFND